MSYTQPAFMLDNIFDAITDVATEMDESTNTNTINNANRRAFIDNRQGSLASWTSTGVDSGIRLDLGAVLSAAPNRVVVPAGHDFDGINFRVESDTSFTLPTPTFVMSTIISGPGVIDRATTNSSTERYWAVESAFTTGRTYSCGGYWIGTREVLSADAFVQPSYANAWRSSVVETEYPNGVASTELAPPRRRFSLEVRNLDPAGTDYDLLDRVAQLGRGRTFWYWPPDTEEPAPFLVNLTADARRRQEFPAPQVSPLYSIALEMEENKL